VDDQLTPEARDLLARVRAVAAALATHLPERGPPRVELSHLDGIWLLRLAHGYAEGEDPSELLRAALAAAVAALRDRLDELGRELARHRAALAAVCRAAEGA